MGWLKQKIIQHWNVFGKTNVAIRRNFETDRIVVDFSNGGPCVAYDYNGKWIAG